jgi:CspA family cold shock protein
LRLPIVRACENLPAGWRTHICAWDWNVIFVGGGDGRVKRSRMSLQGTVKFFNTDKGYGFIKPDDGSRDIFVHITAVEQAGLRGLNEGQRISYDVEPDKKGKGPKAVNLKLG